MSCANTKSKQEHTNTYDKQQTQGMHARTCAQHFTHNIYTQFDTTSTDDNRIAEQNRDAYEYNSL